jgi:hypothetical protein
MTDRDEIMKLDQLLQKLWTKAVGTPNYVKSEWIEVQRKIWQLSEGKKPTKLPLCFECHAPPGQPHKDGCDVERCSSCGGQRLVCDCEDHDPAFARWTGIWPGKAEAEHLGIDLNEFANTVSDCFWMKPVIIKNQVDDQPIPGRDLNEIDTQKIGEYRCPLTESKYICMRNKCQLWHRTEFMQTEQTWKGRCGLIPRPINFQQV